MSSHLLPNILATLTTVLLGFAASIVGGDPAGHRHFRLALGGTRDLPAAADHAIHADHRHRTHPRRDGGYRNSCPRTLVTFLIAFFPLLVSTVTGLLATPKESVDLARALRMNFWQELRFIRMPTAIPFIFSGLRVAISLSVIGAVVAEFVTANAGLGYLITQFDRLLQCSARLRCRHPPRHHGDQRCSAAWLLAERLLFPWSVSADRITRE